MASNLLTIQGGNLYGTGKVKTFKPESRAIKRLAKVQDVNPFLLSRPRTANTVEGYDTDTGEAEDTGSGDSFVDNSPITNINDAIVMPDAGDTESIDSIPEFANLSDGQLRSLGLLGMTPKSLTATFNNLRNIGNIDLAGMGLQALQNLSPPVAAALSIATGNTLNMLQNAINNPSIIGTPAAAFRALSVYNTVSKLNWEDIQNLPERAFAAVEDVMNGFAQIANDPVGSAQAFLNMTGNYAEFGTFSPKINTVQFGNETYNFVTDNRGQVITTPGFIKQLTQGPLSAGVYVAQGLADLAGRFLPGPGLTVQERAQDDFEMAMAAQNGPAREIAPGMTIHATPTTSFLHVQNFEVPGIGPVTQVFNLDRLTAKYGPFELNYGIVEAALQNSMAMYSMEDQERIAEAINQQLGIEWGPALAAAVETVRQEAVAEHSIYENYFGEDTLTDAHRDIAGLREALSDQSKLYDKNPEAFTPQVQKYFETQKKLQQMELMGPDLGQELGGQPSRLTVLNRPLIDKGLFPHEIAGLTREDVDNSMDSYIGSLTGYDGDGYNSPNPSIAALDAANYVMSITGKSTYGHTQQDKDLTKTFLGQHTLTADPLSGMVDHSGKKETVTPDPKPDESRWTLPPGYKEPPPTETKQEIVTPDPKPDESRWTLPPGYKEPPDAEGGTEVIDWTRTLDAPEGGGKQIVDWSTMLDAPEGGGKQITKTNILTGPPSPAKTAAEKRSNLGQTVRDAAAITKRGKEDESKLYQTTEELSIQSDKQAFDAAGGKHALNTAPGKVERALLNVQAAKAQKDWSDANKKNYANLMAQLAAARAEYQNLMDLSYYSGETGSDAYSGEMSTAADGAAGFGMGMY